MGMNYRVGCHRLRHSHKYLPIGTLEISHKLCLFKSQTLV